jgi:hypothetical protein
MTTIDIAKHLRDVPDFPKPGIIFKDITPLLSNGPVFRQVCMDLANRYRDSPVTHIVSVEYSRGSRRRITPGYGNAARVFDGAQSRALCGCKIVFYIIDYIIFLI